MEVANLNFSPKTLPTNLEAEQAVLAAVLMNNRALERVGEFLKPEHFTHPAHQEIYKLAQKQFAAGIPFDIITAKNYLEQQGVLETVGGIDYLTQLANAGVGVMNVEQYGRIVYENALRRELINIGQEITESAFVEDLDKPVATQIEAAEQKLYVLAESGENIDKGPVPAYNAFRAALEEAEIAYKADGKLSGLTTGLHDLDTLTSGLHKSDLIVIAGRPAMGKTTIALNIAYNAALAIRDGKANKKYNGAVIMFSLEMSTSQLAAKVLSSYATISTSAMRNGSLSDTDLLNLAKASDMLSNLPLFFDDTPNMSIPMMRARARRIARKHGGLALIVIDYLQLMTLPGGVRRNDSRVNEVSEITRGLKMLAKELDVPLIALSQLSRGLESREDKRPLLSDLRESGSIEQDADIVMFTFREEYYLQGKNPDAYAEPARYKNTDNGQKKKTNREVLEEERGKADLIIGKNRHGRPDTIRLLFNGEYSLFSDDDSYSNRGADESLGPVYAPPTPNAAPDTMEDLPEDF